MKKMFYLIVGVMLLGMGSAAYADHRGHARFGLYVGIPGPYYYPPHYYPPTYYYPPYYYPQQQVVVVPAAPPPTYIEQAPAQAVPAPAPAAAQNWYYCRSAKAYYPYVQACPEGWQPVPARPSGE